MIDNTPKTIESYEANDGTVFTGDGAKDRCLAYEKAVNEIEEKTCSLNCAKMRAAEFRIDNKAECIGCGEDLRFIGNGCYDEDFFILEIDNEETLEDFRTMFGITLQSKLQYKVGDIVIYSRYCSDDYYECGTIDRLKECFLEELDGAIKCLRKENNNG